MLNHPKSRLVLIAFAGFSLFAGLWAGTVRLGWDLPVPMRLLPSFHGPLMVVGFLGTLIGLERAAAMGRAWPYGVPLFTAAGVLSLLAGFPFQVGAALVTIGSLFLVAVFVSLYRQSPAAHFITMTLSGAAWVAGNCLWLVGTPLYSAAPWWAGFLVLTIAGERLEIARIVRPSWKARVLFHLNVAVVLSGLGFSLFEFHPGVRIAGVGLAALAIWLLRYDIARLTVRDDGLSRYMAICLLSGYCWLVAGGVMWLFFAPQFQAGPGYDAMLHVIFLGFVFSMIFGHAPVIFPSIVGIALPFSHLFYLHLLLLHASLLLRVGGDLTLSAAVQRWGGLLGVLAVMLFLISNLRAAIIGARNRQP